MPADLFAVAVPFCSWIATYLVHSTCLLGGAWLWLQFRAGTSHAARELLWKTALIGGLLTTAAHLTLTGPGLAGDWSFVLARSPDSRVIAAGAGRGVSANESWRDAVADQILNLNPAGEPAIAEDQIVTFDEPVAALGPGPLHADFAATVIAPPVVSRPPDSQWFRPQMGLAVGVLALAGAPSLFAIGRWLWQTALLRRQLRGASPLDSGPAREHLNALCRFVPRCREIRLLSAPYCPEPAAFGLFRWTIVLPARAERDLSDDELRSLLAHELAHLVRGDNWWLLASNAICALGSFQPLNHLARREWQRAAEYLCDAWAVSRTGEPLALARCLTEVAGWRLPAGGCAASLAATGRRTGLVDRIERLAQGFSATEAGTAGRAPARQRALGLALLGLIVVCGPRVTLSTDEPLAEVDPTFDRATANLSEPGLPESAVPRPTDLALAPVGSPARPADPIALLNDLQQQFDALERELAALQPLLDQASVSPAARQLAQSLASRASRIKAQQMVLEKLSESMAVPPVVRTLRIEDRGSKIEDRR
ncbi:MAG: M56 family metallopeptidase [Planctomycetaceae bacterium]